MERVSPLARCGRRGPGVRPQASLVTLRKGVGENFMAADSGGVSAGGPREEVGKVQKAVNPRQVQRTAIARPLPEAERLRGKRNPLQKFKKFWFR